MSVQVGKLGIYSLEFFFLLGIEQCAVANEALIVVFYSSLPVGFEAFAIIVDSLDALKEGIVHGHFVAELRIFGIECLGNLYHFGRRIRLVEGKEYHSHAVEDFARTLKGHDSVFESSSFGVVDDRIDLCLLLLDTGIKSRQIIGVGDTVEWRYLIGRGIRRQKWILTRVAGACSGELLHKRHKVNISYHVIGYNSTKLHTNCQRDK